jgi:hypothetical protein
MSPEPVCVQCINVHNNCAASADAVSSNVPTDIRVVGNSLFIILGEAFDHTEATERCKKLGGDLASIHHDDENDALHALVARMATRMSIAGTDKGMERHPRLMAPGSEHESHSPWCGAHVCMPPSLLLRNNASTCLQA